MQPPDNQWKPDKNIKPHNDFCLAGEKTHQAKGSGECKNKHTREFLIHIFQRNKAGEANRAKLQKSNKVESIRHIMHIEKISQGHEKAAHIIG